jgi:glycosyltransferase involved in cell wall biosynthesis
MLSFCVHSYNEADALRLLVLSSLPMADVFNEWVIVDHRSSDHTPEVIASLEPLLAEHKIALTTFREERDFSAHFTFADIRTATIKACRNKVVVMHDADFLLGPRFGALVQRGKGVLMRKRSTYFGATYAVPCIWDHLAMDRRGKITDHGRVWIHKRRARVLWRDATEFLQVGNGGRWEKVTSTDKVRRRVFHLANPKRKCLPGTVVSVNVKTRERIALRDTMTMFLQDAMQGKAEGAWLENYEAGECRPQPAYEYSKISLRGWHLNASGMELRT